MEWVQTYDPLGSAWLSTACAALPIIVLLVSLAVFEVRAQWAAGAGLVTALLVATIVYGVPARTAGAAAVYGAAYGLFPIGWIVLNAVLLFNITVASGSFEIVKHSIANLSSDRRIQALLIAFCFGAFIEGAAGFGTPVAISAALMMGIGFPPLYAAGLALIANTAPVAFGAVGIPLITLAGVTNLDIHLLSAMAGRQLALMSFIIPPWIVVTMSGWKGLKGVLAPVLVTSVSFSLVQLAWSNLIGVELAAISAAVASLVCLAVFCRMWQPAETWDFSREQTRAGAGRMPDVTVGDRAAATVGVGVTTPAAVRRMSLARAWTPWAMLCVLVTLWGIAPVKAQLASQPWMSPAINMPGLHRMVFRDQPVVPDAVQRELLADPAYKNRRAEAAVFVFNWINATGSAILLTAILAAFFFGMSPGKFGSTVGATLYQMRWPLTTIAFMLSFGYVTRYSGLDATLGLAFTRTGSWYPFFAPLLGWLGVALTGSDTSSNVLFGNLQKITAQQLGLNPILITTANSTGGVMGKMVDAQSIVVSTAATNQSGEEGKIFRFVFWHSIVLAGLMGLIVLAQAYLVPWMVPK